MFVLFDFDDMYDELNLTCDSHFTNALTFSLQTFLIIG